MSRLFIAVLSMLLATAAFARTPSLQNTRSDGAGASISNTVHQGAAEMQRHRHHHRRHPRH